jgi:hypothetical protein
VEGCSSLAETLASGTVTMTISNRSRRSSSGRGLRFRFVLRLVLGFSLDFLRLGLNQLIHLS